MLDRASQKKTNLCSPKMIKQILRASAGSGKTFQLSNVFLRILLTKDVSTVIDKILATTFTIKAAGEISDRILTRFADAALDPDKRSRLAQDTQLKLNETDLQCRLAVLAKNLYRMQVSTLDSYFNRIAKAFLFEIGMPPGWTIIDDKEFERILVTAVGEVFAESDREAAKELMYRFNKGEHKQTVTSELVNLAKSWLPLVRESSGDAWNNEQLFRKTLDDDEILRAVNQLENAELPPHKSIIPQRGKARTAAANQEWSEFLENGLAKAVVKQTYTSYGKPIEGNLRDSLETLVEHAKAVEINKIAAQTKATYDLLKLIIDKLDQITFRTGGFRFEDVTRKLADSRYDFSRQTGSVKYRLNTGTEHLLLDEFQDTSMPQWKIIKPLASQTSNNQDGTFFCVGDVKQAIYGWRGGVAEIFDTVKNELKLPDDACKTMPQTRRNTQAVIDAVNQVFGNLNDNGAITGIQNSDAGAKAVEVWQKRFETHTTANKYDGYCALEVVSEKYESVYAAETIADADNADHIDNSRNSESENDEGDRLSLAMMLYLVDKIKEYTTKELSYAKPNASIGILTRGRAQVGKILAALKNAGIDASGSGGNPLPMDSVAVRYIRSALILADHAGDSIARFHLANSPLAEHLGITDQNADSQAGAASEKLRGNLMNDGYGKVISELAEVLRPSCSEHESSRLEQLIEFGYTFQNTQKSLSVRTKPFIDLLDTEGVESKSPAKVKVMTIHGSKGLEFDIVVLPFEKSSLYKPSGKIVVGRDAPTEPVKNVLRYVNATMQALLPAGYQKMFTDRIRYEIEESLAVLYVAMTRARYELAMLIPEKKEPARRSGNPFSATFADVLRAALCPKENTDTPRNPVYQSKNSKPDWYRHSPLIEQSESESETVVENITWKSLKKETPQNESRQRNLKRDQPSAHHAGINAVIKDAESEHAPTEQSEQTLLIPKDTNLRDNAMKRGTAVHACFEKAIGWLDDGVAADDAKLNKIINEATSDKRGAIDNGEVIKAFRDACEKNEIKAALSKSRYSADVVELECERRFVVKQRRNEDTVIIRGSIDRMVVSRNKNGDVIGVDVFDFKTDRNDDVNALKEIYREQLNVYRESVVNLFKLGDPSIVKTKLILTHCGKVVEIC
ncbi:hypothetical protein FACS189443_3520 [Planctomycetales bacterium]|nr:hypothetical protein FACS189443_3520 [Planctomycetales bacterium]